MAQEGHGGLDSHSLVGPSLACVCLCGEAHHVGKGHTWSFSLFGSGGLCLVRTMLKFSEHERSKLIRIPAGHGCGEGEGTGWGTDHTMPSWSLVTIREVGHLLSSLEEPLVGTPTLQQAAQS